MLIAEQKKKENIAEYILYMWQMEDLIRGSELNVERVMNKIFPEDKPTHELSLEYQEWFTEIVSEMKREGLESEGHLETVQQHISFLNDLHRSLLMTFQDKAYLELYKDAAEDILVLKGRSGSADLTDVEICLTGLYGLMLLRIKNSSISDDTIKAMNRIGKIIAHLAGAYKKYQKGELSLPPELNN